MKKKYENITREGKQINKIYKKSDELRKLIGEYTSMLGYASGLITGGALFEANALIEVLKGVPANRPTTKALLGVLFATGGVSCIIGRKMSKNNVKKGYKELTNLVIDEEDFFNENDAKNMLAINKSINKLMSNNSFLAAVEGIVVATGTYLGITGLNPQTGLDMKSKTVALVVAALEYAFAGVLMTASKNNQKLIDRKTRLLADNLIKPYTANAKTLTRK